MNAQELADKFYGKGGTVVKKDEQTTSSRLRHSYENAVTRRSLTPGVNLNTTDTFATKRM
jgi:hypothetical protein